MYGEIKRNGLFGGGAGLSEIAYNYVSWSLKKAYQYPYPGERGTEKEEEVQGVSRLKVVFLIPFASQLEGDPNISSWKGRYR